MKKGIITNTEDVISDIAGIRIVCSFKSDLKAIASTIINNSGFEIIEIKDYVENPKKNGYSGYHIIVAVPRYHNDGSMEKVKVEIQIRTIAMDMWAILERNLRHKELTDKEREEELIDISSLRKEIDDIDNDMEKIIENIIPEPKQLIDTTKTKRLLKH